MRQIFAVFKRELGLYFRSPVAYAITFALLLFFGLQFSSAVTSANGQAPADALNYVPSLLTFLMFLVAPLLTMRLLAEETREGTLEVIMTMPIRESQFIIGKFLAVWAFYTVILLLTVVYHLILTTIGIPDYGRAFSMYLGAWLYGGATLALAMIWSAVTEDQVVAAFLGAATVLVFYLSNVAATAVSNLPNVSEGLGAFIRELGLQSHYETTLLNGIVRAEDILYFVFLIVAALFITTRIVEVRRWRS
ncbi:MAG: ABC transporter permease [Anaerolineae bacterium]|nr:ABC transporter permease [Anaerolineae bacterium]MBN8620131.1 ABC transporter permease [Anaerolineae bacterium]